MKAFIMPASGALALAIALGANAYAATSSTPTQKVAIADYAFKPSTVTVLPGTDVVWTNADDDPHTVTADDKSFDSHGLGQGDTYEHVFTKPGRYAYHCSAHPFMKGIIIVKGGSGS